MGDQRPRTDLLDANYFRILRLAYGRFRRLTRIEGRVPLEWQMQGHSRTILSSSSVI